MLIIHGLFLVVHILERLVHGSDLSFLIWLVEVWLVLLLFRLFITSLNLTGRLSSLSIYTLIDQCSLGTLALISADFLQIGESAGPECKAVLQEITKLIDQMLPFDGKALRKLYGADEVR